MNLKYEQPNMEQITKEYDELLNSFRTSTDVSQQLETIEKINQIRDNFFSMYWLSYINYLLDVNSEYWNEQENFFAKNDPIIDNYKLKYYQALNSSPFKEEIAQIIGTKVFQIAECEVQLLNEDAVLDMEQERKLSRSYSKLIASAKVNYNGEEMRLSKLMQYLVSGNRDVRIEASNARFTYFRNVEADIDKLLDDLIKVRTDIAHKMGFDSYTKVGYIKMKRLDYGVTDVENFRNNVVKYLVPMVMEMKEQQKVELGLDELRYYDEPILFKDGNPIPKGNTEWVLDQAAEMYENINSEMYSLFNKMRSEGLMDVESRPGKSAGGITTFIPIYEVPVFISSFSHSMQCVKSLTHEFGHAFQLYSSYNLKYYENWWPSFDECEIHSTAMELLTLPYMESFFGKDKDKFEFAKMYGLLHDTCYMCLVDEFQHVIYDEPNLTSQERKARWHDLEKKYMPWSNFADNDYLESGNTWQKQSHIFTDPFYYIDYALANVVALQFYSNSIENPEGTWDKYIDFCKLGGSYSFRESLEQANLDSPFEEDVVKKIVKKIEIKMP